VGGASAVLVTPCQAQGHSQSGVWMNGWMTHNGGVLRGSLSFWVACLVAAESMHPVCCTRCTVGGHMRLQNWQWQRRCAHNQLIKYSQLAAWMVHEHSKG
jgi:hypothetical protein